MTLVPTNRRALARTIRIPEFSIQSVLLLVDSSQRTVLFHCHIDLLQHSVTLDQEISLSQCRNAFSFLRFANDLWLERVWSISSRNCLLLCLYIRLENYFVKIQCFTTLSYFEKPTFEWEEFLLDTFAHLFLSWSCVVVDFCVTFGLSECNFESLHLPEIFLLSCSFIFIYQQNSLLWALFGSSCSLNILLRKLMKHLVFLLLNSWRFFPSSGCRGILIHGNAALFKEWLVPFTVATWIDSAEIAHMLILPFKLLLQVFLRFVKLRCADRRIIRTVPNSRSELPLYPGTNYGTRTFPLIYLPSFVFIPWSNLSLTRFLSSSIIFFLSHCCKFNISNVLISRPSFTSLSICASVWKLGEWFTWSIFFPMSTKGVCVHTRLCV